MQTSNQPQRMKAQRRGATKVSRDRHITWKQERRERRAAKYQQGAYA